MVSQDTEGLEERQRQLCRMGPGLRFSAEGQSDGPMEPGPSFLGSRSQSTGRRPIVDSVGVQVAVYATQREFLGNPAPPRDPRGNGTTCTH
jgi:hypothetical protein